MKYLFDNRRLTLRSTTILTYPFEKMKDVANWFDNTPLCEAERLQIGRTNAIKLFKLNLK